jgi:hypothetical protein
MAFNRDSDEALGKKISVYTDNLRQEQVSKLSDFQVNKGIAEFLDIYMSDNGFGAVRVWVSGVPNSIKGVAKDYCNNWNDILPEMVKHNISFLVNSETTPRKMAERLIIHLEKLQSSELNLKRLFKPFNNYLISDCGKVKHTTMHRIVAKMFLGESELHVNHIDGNKGNNDISNLEYVTMSENQQHRYTVLKTGSGTESAVIRSDGKKYPSMASTKLDGFHPSGVCKVCTGQMKTHKGFGWSYA